MAEHRIKGSRVYVEINGEKLGPFENATMTIRITPHKCHAINCRIDRTEAQAHVLLSLVSRPAAYP